MIYYKLTTDVGPIYRSFDSENFLVVEVFNGTNTHKRMAKTSTESLYNFMMTKTTDNGFVETTEEEFTLNKTEVLSILNG